MNLVYRKKSYILIQNFHLLKVLITLIFYYYHNILQNLYRHTKIFYERVL